MNFLGVDPGKLGGIALISDGVAEAWKMPETEHDVFAIFMGLPKVPTYGLLERVASSPQMGVVSAFTFGRGYGFLVACLLAANIPSELITPRKWQSKLGCLTKGDKNVSKRKAQQLFPHLKITHHTADALLIAEYARRTYVTAS